MAVIVLEKFVGCLFSFTGCGFACGSLESACIRHESVKRGILIVVEVVRLRKEALEMSIVVLMSVLRNAVMVF